MHRATTRSTGYLWNPAAETQPRAERAALQGERLRSQIARAYERVPFYRAALERQGVQPGDIRSIADIERLPFTVKDDFRVTYPYGLFAVPLSEIVRL
jgi:phenylacetate-CoA ligase